MARTDDVRAVGGWDEDLKLNEHGEFFLRVMQRGFGVAYLPDVTVRHWCARSEHYHKYRDRDYVGLAMSKHGISVYTDMMSRSRRSGTVVSCSSSILECGALFAFSNEHEGEAKKDRDHLRRSFQDGIPQVPRS